MTLTSVLIVAAILFAIGLVGVLTRRNLILVLVGIELMLNAANLNLVAFWRFSEDPTRLDAQLFVLFSIAVAAAEVAVGLAIVLHLFRLRRTVDIEDLTEVRG